MRRNKRVIFIISCVIFFLSCSLSTASMDKEWYSSALEYNKITMLLAKIGSDKPVNDLLIKRGKSQNRLLSSKFPGQKKIISLLNSDKLDDNIVAIINLKLRKNYNKIYIESIISMNMNSKKSPMVRFFSYSYFNNINIKILKSYEDQLLEIVRHEDNEDNFIMALPFLLHCDSNQVDLIISNFLSNCSKEIKKNICAYIDNEKEILLKSNDICNMKSDIIPGK